MENRCEKKKEYATTLERIRNKLTMFLIGKEKFDIFCTWLTQARSSQVRSGQLKLGQSRYVGAG